MGGIVIAGEEAVRERIANGWQHFSSAVPPMSYWRDMQVASQTPNVSTPLHLHQHIEPQRHVEGASIIPSINDGKSNDDTNDELSWRPSSSSSPQLQSQPTSNDHTSKFSSNDVTTTVSTAGQRGNDNDDAIVTSSHVGDDGQVLVRLFWKDTHTIINQIQTNNDGLLPSSTHHPHPPPQLATSIRSNDIDMDSKRTNTNVVMSSSNMSASLHGMRLAHTPPAVSASVVRDRQLAARVGRHMTQYFNHLAPLMTIAPPHNHACP
jgi:hypothetical protein